MLLNDLHSPTSIGSQLLAGFIQVMCSHTTHTHTLTTFYKKCDLIRNILEQKWIEKRRRSGREEERGDRRGVERRREERGEEKWVEERGERRGEESGKEGRE